MNVIPQKKLIQEVCTIKEQLKGEHLDPETKYLLLKKLLAAYEILLSG